MASLLDGLVSYWQLDEASGDAIDAHGTNTLTDGNTVGSAAGIINNARDFRPAQSENFYTSSNASLQTGDIGFCISFWVKHRTIGGFGFYVNKSGAVVASREYAVYYTSDQFAFFVHDTTGVFRIVRSGVVASTTQWQHIIAWHDPVANVLAISANGSNPSTLSHSLGVRITDQEFEIGGRRSGGLFHDGLIDEVGFWKRVLTPAERTALYNSGNGLSYDKFKPPGLSAIVASHYAALGI